MMKKVVIVSSSLESKIFKPHNFNLLIVQHIKVRRYLKKILILQKKMFRYLAISDEKNKKLRKIAKENKVKYLLQSDFQCDVKR